MPAGQPPIFETAEEMQQKADAFIEQCRKNKQPLTIAGLCYELGFESRQSFYDYEKRPQFSYTIKRLRLFVESGYEGNLHGNNPTGSIFALKNMGWKDKSEMDLNALVKSTEVDVTKLSEAALKELRDAQNTND